MMHYLDHIMEMPCRVGKVLQAYRIENLFHIHIPNLREILAKLYVLGVSRLNDLPQSKNSTTPERAILSAQNSVPTFGFGNE